MALTIRRKAWMVSKVKKLFTALRSRLRSRSDTEHVMSANRSVFCVVLAAYVFALNIGPSYFGPMVLAVGLSITAAIFLHLLAFPQPNVLRRTLALLADISTITLVMHVGDEAAAIFFPLILWTVFGNGFRFGVAALWRATAVGLSGFALMATVTPFWAGNASLTIGLGIGLLIVPAYASVLIKSLTKAKSRAEAANQAKTAFLTSVSHELRTPLQAIIGTNGLLGGTRLTPEQADLSRTMTSASQSLLVMINDLLQFSRIEAGETEIEQIEFDVVALLREVKGMMVAACQLKGLRIALHIGLDTPLRVKADRRHIREVLINLVANAVKFTPEGGVLLAVNGQSQDNASPMLNFEVIDTGIGVAQDAREQIFERFAQADRTISERFGGTGLGLAICRRLATLLGGRIGVRDGGQSGSVFWFLVPVMPLECAWPSQDLDRAPVSLELPIGVAKGRLFEAASQQGRNVTYRQAEGASLRERIADALGSGRLLIMETPRSEQSAADLTGAISRAGAGRAVPVVLVDGEAMPGSTADLRWLAPVRLRSKFTDSEMDAAFAIGDRLAARPEHKIEAAAASRPDQRCHVLVADDNRTNQLVFTKILESGGHTSRVAADGEQALIALEQEEFDLVLMDVNMPGIDGIEATKLHRIAELGTVRVPIIGLTADATPDMAQKCRAAGMDDCVVKPVSAGALLQVIEQTIARVSRAGRAAEGHDAAKGRSGVAQDIDRKHLLDLEKIGGKAFVNEVVAEFVLDARGLLRDMLTALAQADFAQVHSIAHALASASSNVGAVRLRWLGLEIEKMPHSRLRAEGHERAQDVTRALDKFMAALTGPEDGPAGVGRQPSR